MPHLKMIVPLPTSPSPISGTGGAPFSSSSAAASKAAAPRHGGGGGSSISGYGGGPIELVENWQTGGSANVSPVAWGKEILGGSALMLENFELGVVLPPILHVRLPVPQSSSPAAGTITAALRSGLLCGSGGAVSTVTSAPAAPVPTLPPALIAALRTQFPALVDFRLVWGARPVRHAPAWDPRAPHYDLRGGEVAFTSDYPGRQEDLEGRLYGGGRIVGSND